MVHVRFPHQTTPQRLLLLLAACALLALVVFAALPHSTRFMHELHKSGHFVVFAALSLIILRLLGRPITYQPGAYAALYAWSFMLTVVAGGATEVAQIFVNRGASLLDVLRDAGGAVAALSIHAAFRDHARDRAGGRRCCSGCMAVGALACLASLAPLIWCVAAYANRELWFPLLWQRHSVLDRYFLSADSSRALVLEEPHPDWTPFRNLAVDISNQQTSALQVVIRVHDRSHNWLTEDRFNQRVWLAAGQRTVVRLALRDIERAPKGRRMNLAQIAGVAVFVPNTAVAGQFHLNALRLEP
jgi:VanZ family protein